jgi:predicted methyltransferase
MKRIAFVLLFALACKAPQPAIKSDAPAPARTPAPVMSAHGADWLERPEREVEERPDLVLAAMQLREGDVVAEIGAGSGYFARRIARVVGPNGIVYANDIQPEMIELIRSYAAREGLTNVRPILGGEIDPKLPPKSVDWILLVDVYHEFQKPQPMLARMREALKPDGRVMLVEYRGEGDSAKHIRDEHRMTKEQVLREWIPAGYKLESISEVLPSQRMYIWSAAAKPPL